jgi:hypothetical protein
MRKGKKERVTQETTAVQQGPDDSCASVIAAQTPLPGIQGKENIPVEATNRSENAGW